MAGRGIRITLTVEQKVPAQNKIHVSIANKKISSSTYKHSGGSSSKVLIDKTQKISSSTYKYSGGSSSSRVTKACKAGNFVDKGSGREGFIKEASYKSTHIVKDKAHSGVIKKQSSSRVTKTCKTGNFVDKGSGREVFIKEANYKSTHKVNHKLHGVTTEFETVVKSRKTTTYDNSKNYKRVNYY